MRRARSTKDSMAVNVSTSSRSASGRPPHLRSDRCAPPHLRLARWLEASVLGRIVRVRYGAVRLAHFDRPRPRAPTRPCCAGSRARSRTRSIGRDSGDPQASGEKRIRLGGTQIAFRREAGYKSSTSARNCRSIPTACVSPPLPERRGAGDTRLPTRSAAVSSSTPTDGQRSHRRRYHAAAASIPAAATNSL